MLRMSGRGQSRRDYAEKARAVRAGVPRDLVRNADPDCRCPDFGWLTGKLAQSGRTPVRLT